MILRLLFIACFTAILLIRVGGYFGYSFKQASFQPSLANLDASTLRIIAGPVPGLAADFCVLEVFSIFNEMQKSSRAEYGDYLYQDLKSAVDLDSRFYDPYRLASSILVFDAGKPKEAVYLLEKGTFALPLKWDIPFLAGFIAYDQLHDHQKAFQLMSEAAKRKGAPPMIPMLATRFLSQTSGKEDAIMFLQSLLDTLPDIYQEGIRQRIKALRGKGE